jgi:hypothetical protein
MDHRLAYLDGTYRDIFEVLASKHNNPFGVDCAVKARPPCLCGRPVVGASTRVVRLCSKLRKVEQIGVEITHAATRMRLLGKASNDEYKQLLQQIFPTLSTDKLLPLLSDTERSEMRTYGMAGSS